MLEASKKIGQSLDNPIHYAEWMRDAGFVNVQHVVYKWPLNPWPLEKKNKTLGLWTLANALDGVEGFTVAMFTRVLGWDPAEVQSFLVDVRKDFKNKGIHSYLTVWVTFCFVGSWTITLTDSLSNIVFGQKPE